MEKIEVEQKLRSILAALPEGRIYTTRHIAELVFGDAVSAGQVGLIIKMGKALNLATRGPPREGKSFMKGKIVFPLLWSHIVTAMPEPTAYAVSPSEMTVGDVAGSLASTYTPRKEQGTFGPASRVRAVDPEIEALQQRIKDHAAKLKDLEARINLLEMKDKL